APLAGRPLLGLLAHRLAPARVDAWWLATTTRPHDDVTAAWGEALGWRGHRGPVDDVLARFDAVVARCRPDWIVRVTADDPFTDAGIVDRLLAPLAELPEDVAFVEAAGGVLPLGYAPQVARGAAVRAAARAAREPFHRAHVLTWVAAHARRHAVSLPAAWPRRAAWRWTIDTPDDLAMARAAFASFGPDADYPAMVAALDAQPAIPAANAHVRQKAIEEG